MRSETETAGNLTTDPVKKTPAGSRGGAVRLDRFLAQEGLGTRSTVKKAIRAGKASVNGKSEKDPGRQILPEDQVIFDGKKLGREQYVYYMLNKPAGVVSATEDGRLPTVLDLLRAPGVPDPVTRRGLFPVGRLDRDTEGLLLVTDDGQLAHRLLSPKMHVDKTYYAVVTGHVSEEDIRKFAEGMQVDQELTALPARLRVLESASAGAEGRQAGSKAGNAQEQKTPLDISENKNAQLPDCPFETEPALIACMPQLPPGVTEYTRTLVTIREGKFHQIKRMFAALGKDVLYLKRLSMGPLQLDPALAPGCFRPLTEDEIGAIREA